LLFSNGKRLSNGTAELTSSSSSREQAFAILPPSRIRRILSLDERRILETPQILTGLREALGLPTIKGLLLSVIVVRKTGVTCIECAYGVFGLACMAMLCPDSVSRELSDGTGDGKRDDELAIHSPGRRGGGVAGWDDKQRVIERESGGSKSA
jgi:hypothetical protein